MQEKPSYRFHRTGERINRKAKPIGSTSPGSTSHVNRRYPNPRRNANSCSSSRILVATVLYAHSCPDSSLPIGAIEYLYGMVTLEFLTSAYSDEKGTKNIFLAAVFSTALFISSRHPPHRHQLEGWGRPVP